MPDRSMWRIDSRDAHIGLMIFMLRVVLALIVGVLAVRAVKHLVGSAQLPDERVAPAVVASVDLDSVRQARAAIRRRIDGSATYLGYGLSETDSVLRRWRSRTVTPLRVYVSADVPSGHTVGHSEAARRAFRRWERVGAIPVAFEFVRDSTIAEVVVRWVEAFPRDRSGQADVVWDQAGWLRSAVLTLATRSPEGWAITPDVAYAVALHEIGHLLGLGHSDEAGDLMYPTTSVHDLTARDRRTARLLYALPPGTLRKVEEPDTSRR